MIINLLLRKFKGCFNITKLIYKLFVCICMLRYFKIMCFINNYFINFLKCDFIFIKLRCVNL